MLRGLAEDRAGDCWEFYRKIHLAGVTLMGRNNKNPVFAAFGLAASIGLNIVATVAVGLFGGRWLDRYFATFPWFTVGGIVLGMLAGLWSVYKRIMQEYS
ncbi:Putative F0F1-ATPase subunit Ca2+/Mg2+ transporter [Dendrosporobacter quercicolus]|uniref:Putative F0F1-ATPase subunit Ca2+/Mg2+ transporter n=1 Tax=Dendrosporobacter quercicolus TaxID=146817 RepID=A0A1G9R3J4_9FIRM|nr:AtpZ/AtpI family protein [Dendrosporobacter quercicolus]SDM16995.1 Putative F0F1-ATPase subunit Ca2+/Mg2+ transporter [Dendrosporobacter quercicolus]